MNKTSCINNDIECLGDNLLDKLLEATAKLTVQIQQLWIFLLN